LGYENLVKTERELLSLLACDPGAVQEFMKHFGAEKPPDDPTRLRVLINVFMQISAYESLYYRYIKEAFPPDLWEQWNRSMANSFLKDEDFRWIWEKTGMKEFLWRPFVDHVDQDFFYSKPKP
jgi:hypothetical protein